jgi:magnesium chelatase family protein
MIAKRIPSILPLPTREEFLEILAIHSAAGMTLDGALRFGGPLGLPTIRFGCGAARRRDLPQARRGFAGPPRGALPRRVPGVQRSAMEVLRQPLEDGEVTISRSAAKITLPCRCMLVAAMNPCPCRTSGRPGHRCRCTPTQIQHYRARVSGRFWTASIFMWRHGPSAWRPCAAMKSRELRHHSRTRRKGPRGPAVATGLP